MYKVRFHFLQDIFPDFLKHTVVVIPYRRVLLLTVLVFNKWTSPNWIDKYNLKNEYQELIKNHFSFLNIPCYTSLIDSLI